MARVVVLADDLIWAMRLRSLVAAAGAEAVPARSVTPMTEALAASSDPGFALIDLTSRAYEPIAAVSAAVAAGASVLAVGQHDAVEERRAALDAGAARFVAYRRLVEDGTAILRGWLDSDPRVTGAQRPSLEATES